MKRTETVRRSLVLELGGRPVRRVIVPEEGPAIAAVVTNGPREEDNGARLLTIATAAELREVAQAFSEAAEFLAERERGRQ